MGRNPDSHLNACLNKLESEPNECHSPFIIHVHCFMAWPVGEDSAKLVTAIGVDLTRPHFVRRLSSKEKRRVSRQGGGLDGWQRWTKSTTGRCLGIGPMSHRFGQPVLSPFNEKSIYPAGCLLLLFALDF